jgi:hypothetical protein
MARRPLVKLGALVAPESAVKMLQAALPPRSREQPAVELENVAATLLLPPTGARVAAPARAQPGRAVFVLLCEAVRSGRGSASRPSSRLPPHLLQPLAEKGGLAAALAGGVFELGDRVAAIGGSGSPPFASRGTVVGVYDDAVEVSEFWRCASVCVGVCVGEGARAAMCCLLHCDHASLAVEVLWGGGGGGAPLCGLGVGFSYGPPWWFWGGPPPPPPPLPPRWCLMAR